MTTEQLKPCPFCGGNASQPEQRAGTGRPVWDIGCGTLFCFTMRRSSKKEAIASWNTRAPVEQLSAQTAEPAWITALRKEILVNSKATHNFEFSRDEVMELLSAHPPVIQTEQPSLSDAELHQRACDLYDELQADPDFEWNCADRTINIVGVIKRALLAQRQDSDRTAELEAEVKQLRSERDAQQWYPFQDSGKDARIAALEAALRSVNAVATERGDIYGACDQIDNDGHPYQSAWFAGLLANGSVMAKDR